MRTLKPRIIITINEGLIDGVHIDGHQAFLDLMKDVEVVKVDYDTEGSLPQDGLYDLEGNDVWFSVGGFDEPSDGFLEGVSETYEVWAHTPGPQ